MPQIPVSELSWFIAMTSSREHPQNWPLLFTNISFVLVLCCVVGLFFSRALLSISTAALGAMALYQFIKSPRLWLDKPVIIVSILMVLYLISSIFITDEAHMEQFGNEAATKLAFIAVLVPLMARPFPQGMVAKVLVFFCVCAMAVSVATFVNYLLHFEEINFLISQSKPIPIITGHFHISFSYMLGFAVLAGVGLLFAWKEEVTIKKSFIVIPLIVNFILIHVIAARTGLLSMYAGLLVAGFFFLAIEKKAPLKASMALVGLIGFGTLAVLFIKPLNNRFQNTVVDVSNYLNGGNANWWSGGMRLEGLENGWFVFLDHPITGIGMANLDDAVQAKYAERGTLLLKENRINPHNQLLSYLISGGIIAGSLLVVILLMTFRQAWLRANWLLMGFVVLSFVGFNLEAFLERQFGSCFFGLLTGLLFSLNFSRK